jgi:uncharacterized alpha/beta hydrolase family protein
LPKTGCTYRKSNTEPIIRIYTEAATQQADELAEQIIDEIKAIGTFNQIKYINPLYFSKGFNIINYKLQRLVYFVDVIVCSVVCGFVVIIVSRFL